MENRKKIDDLFKSELGNYTETPPPAVWDALERKLDHAPSRKPVIPFKWFAFFAALCVFVAISVLVARNNTGSRELVETTTTPAQNNQVQNTRVADNTTNNTEPIAASETNAASTKQEEGETGTTPADHTGQSATADRTKQQDTKAIADKQQKNTTSIIIKHKTKQTSNPIAVNSSRKSNLNNKNHTTTKKIRNSKNTNSVTGAADENTADATPPAIAYNSAPPESSSVENKSKKEEDPAPEKVKDARKDNVPPAPADKKKPAKPRFDRFEAGIKAGYEQGATNDQAKKVLVSPYLQYKLTRRFAIMLQPAVKYATLSSRQIDATSYYNLNGDGTLTQKTDKAPIQLIPGDSQDYWKWYHTYTETHDSIVKTNRTGAKYMELEMPILAKYYVTDDFAFYGGLNITYSQLTGLTEDTYVEKGISRSATEWNLGPANMPPPSPPTSLSTEIVYTGTPYSSYTGSKYPAPQGSTFRFGYMLGFTYEYEKRWLFDALVQQTFIKPNMQGGFNTYTPLSAPYFRLTVGYKIFK